MLQINPKDLDTLIANIDYFVGFCGHNKNLTQKQYNKLVEIQEIINKIGE